MMTEIIYGVAASLDGFIAPPDGGSAWLEPFGQAGREHVGRFLKTVDALVMGSRTYEQALTYGGSAALGKPCFVCSSRQLPVKDPLVTITAGSPEQVVEEMTRRGIKRAWHFGGALLFSSFRNAGLITEYSLGIVPVVLGGGMPLFESPGPAAHLQLVESNTHPTGVLLVTYRVVPGRKTRPKRATRSRQA